MNILNYDNQKLLYQYPSNSEFVLKLKKRSKNNKISIFSDSMFKAMFQNENRIKYSCKLLSYLLNIPYEELLKTLKLGKNEMDKKLEIEKSERCDYIAYISGMAVNIEINCNKDVVMMERNIEYMNRLYSRKVKKGEKLDYTQVIQININNFAFQGVDEIVDVYYLQNRIILY